MEPVVNSKGYAYHNGKANSRPRLVFEVSFITDMVPGAFHNPEDLANWIAQNPYVDTVKIKL